MIQDGHDFYNPAHPVLSCIIVFSQQGEQKQQFPTFVFIFHPIVLLRFADYK
jgi:hypothetical protein